MNNTTITMIAWVVFAVTIVAATVIIPYCLAMKAHFLYAIREGFVSILVKGGKNGAFDRLVGAMKGYRIDQETADIILDDTAKPMGFWGLVWIGLWPLNSAMVFDTEQTKLTNEEDGSIGWKRIEYKGTIYVPIQSTERLIIKDLSLSDMAKVDLDAVLTYEMTNAYTAHIKNRGSIKRVKAVADEGLRESVSELTYEQALRLKNATGEGLKDLVHNLNEREETGFGKLGKVTGYRIVTINLVNVQLSGATRAKMEDVFVKGVTADKEAAAMVKLADASAYKIEKEGKAKGVATAAQTDQAIRRLEAQKQLSPEQAMALALENTNATVVNIGGNSTGATPLINLDNPKKGPKKWTSS